MKEFIPPKKRIIKSKGCASSRTSKRQVGAADEVIKITRATKSRATSLC